MSTHKRLQCNMNPGLSMLCVFGLICIPHSTEQSKVCECIYHEYTLNVTCSKPDPVEIRTCLADHRAAMTLLLQNCGLLVVPDSVDLLDNLTTLDVSHNAITRLNLTNIPSVCRNIQALRLDFNNIDKLMKGDLDCLSSLQCIYLANNSLTFIEPGVVNEKQPELQYIHIVNNKLISADFSLIMGSPSMRYHGRINASWNSISVITNDLNFTIMDINQTMSFFVGLIHNNFTTIDVQYYLRLFSITNIFQLLRLGSAGFDLRFNPFICDCALYPFGKDLKWFHPMDPNNPVFSLTCDTPPSLNGRLIYQVPPYEYNCSVTDRCPPDCDCTNTVAEGLVTVNCGDGYKKTSLPEFVPSARELRLTVHSPWLTVLFPIDYLYNVTVLDVSKSRVTQVEPAVIRDLESVTCVFLNDNALQTLPTKIQQWTFKNSSVLTLDGNPFSCDCNSLWLKKWLLQNKQNIPNQDKILCGSGKGKGNVLVNVPDSDFVCEDGYPMNKVLIISVATVLLMAIVLCFFLRREKINLWMIEYFSSSWCRKTMRSGREFDIFISHSSLDDDFVHRCLIQKLETHSPPYKVFIDERHFLPGYTIAANINRAIELSHTTLMVVSNHFLQSKWCMMEFRQAHIRLLRERNVQLVVIVRRGLDHTQLDPELRVYMRTHLYLSEDHKHFWAKLLQVLPILVSEPSSSSRVPVERSISANTHENSRRVPDECSISANTYYNSCCIPNERRISANTHDNWREPVERSISANTHENSRRVPDECSISDNTRDNRRVPVERSFSSNAHEDSSTESVERSFSANEHESSEFAPLLT